jgi:hypothetical protein
MNLTVLTKPKLLAFGVPAALMSQCAPQQCAPAPTPAAASYTVTGSTAHTITVEAETGYVH